MQRIFSVEYLRLGWPQIFGLKCGGKLAEFSSDLVDELSPRTFVFNSNMGTFIRSIVVGEIKPAWIFQQQQLVNSSNKSSLNISECHRSTNQLY